MQGNKLRVAALISGGGTTMQQVIKACHSKRLTHVEVVCVVASNYQADGIRKAIEAGIPTADVLVRRPKDYGSPEEFGAVLIAECQRRRVDFIAQLGWLPLTPANVVETYKNMMSNQHPGPLRTGRPDFGGKGMYGRRVHCARLNFVRSTERNFWTEVVCQGVAVDYDLGPVIKMQRVPIEDGDDTTTLQQRALPIEHEVQIEALNDVSQNRIQELAFDDDLVWPVEELVLQHCKAKAIEEWPHG